MRIRNECCPGVQQQHFARILSGFTGNRRKCPVCECIDPLDDTRDARWTSLISNEILNVNFKNVETKRLRKIVLVTIGDASVKNRRKIGGKIMVESIFPVIIKFLRFPPIRPSVEFGEISGSRVHARSVDKRADSLIAATPCHRLLGRSSILHFVLQHLQRVSEILRGCAGAPDEVPTSPLRPAIVQDVSFGFSGRRNTTRSGNTFGSSSTAVAGRFFWF